MILSFEKLLYLLFLLTKWLREILRKWIFVLVFNKLMFLIENFGFKYRINCIVYRSGLPSSPILSSIPKYRVNTTMFRSIYLKSAKNLDIWLIFYI